MGGMKLGRVLLAVLLAILGTPAWAGPNGAGLSVNGALGTAGQLIGTPSANNANQGNVGEFVSVVVGGPVSLSSGTSTDIASVSLTAGDWDCSGNIGVDTASSTLVQILIAWISTTSATLPSGPNLGAYTRQQFPIPAGASENVLPVGRIRVSIASTSTVYLSIQPFFTVSTLTGYGFLGCRRAR